VANRVRPASSRRRWILTGNEGKAMKIKLDRTSCDGFGKDAGRAPLVFALDEWGYASLAGSAEVPDNLKPRIRRAILDCALESREERPAAPA
jgi:ferredoxin